MSRSVTTVSAQLVSGRRDTRQHSSHRKPDADQPGGTDRDIVRFTVHGLSDGFGGGCRILEAGSAGAGVGTAGVEHHRVQHAVGDSSSRPDDRSRDHAVRGEDRGRIEPWTLVDDQGQIGLGSGLDARRDSCGGESLGCGDAHGATPIADSPVVSGSPSARFMD